MQDTYFFVCIDFYHAAAVLHKHKTFCPSSLAVKNLKTSLDGQKRELFKFSWDLTWPPREKGLLSIPLILIFRLLGSTGVHLRRLGGAWGTPFKSLIHLFNDDETPLISSLTFSHTVCVPKNKNDAIFLRK